MKGEHKPPKECLCESWAWLVTQRDLLSSYSQKLPFFPNVVSSCSFDFATSNDDVLAIIEQLYGHWAIGGYTDSSTRRWCRMSSSRSQLRRCFVFWLCGSWCFRFRNPSGIRSNMFFDFLSETLTFKWGKFGGWYVPCRTDHCLCTFRHDDTDTGVLNALGVSSTFKHVQTLRHIVVFVVFLYIYIYWSSKSGLVPNVGI